MMKKFKYVGLGAIALFIAPLFSTSAFADDPWVWSDGMNAYYYRDNNGSVHYSDGSVSQPSTAWTDNTGKWVYAANSAGPADTTGQYAYQQPAIDESNIAPPPYTAPANAGYSYNTEGPVFGPSSAPTTAYTNNGYYAAVQTATATTPSPAASSSVWQWSDGLNAYYYRDNDGRVHYSDGSVGETNTAWTDSTGKWVYAANSAGPSDTTGQYAYQQKAINEAAVGAPPATAPSNVGYSYANNGGAVFGPSSAPTAPYSNSGWYEANGDTSVATETVAATSYTGTDSSAWAWSDSLGSYYYRDNDGRVHYSDGSVSQPDTVWTDSSGKTVYSANSEGPSDTTGQYAYQQKAIDESNIGPPPSSAPAGATTNTANTGGAVFGGSKTANVSSGTMTAATAAVKGTSSGTVKVASAGGIAGSVKGWRMQ